MAQYATAQDDQAQSNVDIVVTAMRELFADKDLTAIDRYWAEPYIQHSPQMPNGLDILRQVVPNLEGFRLDDGRIVEHWDVVQDIVSPEESANGNAMV
ncbi:hypothetical protein GCM10022384_42340 [Streptomyces marokkonensis]|uniref:SnoaL-like domain-containing protein n=1 Tax=Streptomyces marokkonensis TaxID=324855 RepID=A0ABP7QZ55_9ACTN